MARQCAGFDGKKVICGGTTAKIIARELNRPINVDMRNFHPEVPPLSIMDGIDLVTEGIITMTKPHNTLKIRTQPQKVVMLRINFLTSSLNVMRFFLSSAQDSMMPTGHR
jgi:hypothetical protein